MSPLHAIGKGIVRYETVAPGARVSDEDMAGDERGREDQLYKDVVEHDFFRRCRHELCLLALRFR